jgi:hypothetical protein
MKKPALTKAMRKAGILSIGSRNLNGSYTCRQRLDCIDVHTSVGNYRKYDKKHMAELKRDFYEMAMRNPILMYVPNRRKVPTIDARHTVQLLLAINAELAEKNEPPRYVVIECDVFFRITQQQAAKIFYYLTQRSKRMDPWSAFYAAQHAKFQFAVEITELLDEFGLTTPIDDGIPPNREADITSAEPLTIAWAHGGKGFVSDLFTLVYAFVDDDGRLDPLAGTSGFMRGLMDLLRQQPDYTADQLAVWLGRQDAQFFKSIAHDISNRDKRRLARCHYREAFERVIPIQRRRAA